MDARVMVSVSHARYGARESFAVTDAAQDNGFTFITLNTWRLREVHRVPRLVAALAELAASLGEPAGALPDVVALQELEAPAAIDALARALAPTHDLVTCLCARTMGGANRSVLGVAVRRARFTPVGHECIGIGALFPDHPRCALAAALRPAGTPDHEPPVHVVDVHLSSRPANAAQARVFAEALRARGLWDAPRTMVAGDFNVPPGSAAFAHLAAGPLRDPFDPARGETHWFGRRLDHVLIGPGLALAQPLDQARARAAVRQARTIDLFDAVRGRDAPDAPVSDHAPEGGRFGFVRASA